MIKWSAEAFQIGLNKTQAHIILLQIKKTGENKKAILCFPGEEENFRLTGENQIGSWVFINRYRRNRIPVARLILRTWTWLRRNRYPQGRSRRLSFIHSSCLVSSTITTASLRTRESVSSAFYSEAAPVVSLTSPTATQVRLNFPFLSLSSIWPLGLLRSQILLRSLINGIRCFWVFLRQKFSRFRSFSYLGSSEIYIEQQYMVLRAV